MVSNKLNALIKITFLLLASGVIATMSSCSNHEARMSKLKADHANKYEKELMAQQDSLHWADSILLEITPIINEMIEKGHFEYVRNEYDELGRFVPKGSEADNNIGRNYLHAMVNEYGICQLISEYRGGSPLNHTQIRIEGGDGSNCISAIVPLEMDGANYRFQNQGTWHETVTFTNDSVLSYIDLHVDDAKLKCVQMNAKGKTNNVNITSAERRQLSDCYRLGKALAIQLRCSQTSKVASEKITLLKSKLESQSKTDNN